MIKHISFDLWLTLIKSHPDFKLKRALFLEKEFNPNRLSLIEVMDIVKNVDKICDRLNEISGNKVVTELMYRRILEKLGNNSIIINDELLTNIKLHINNVFLKYEPILLNNSIRPMLNLLKNEGYSLNISSNTVFIEGEILIQTFKNLDLFDYFDFFVFSDEINASKPSYCFFEKVHKNIALKKTEIIHIGDNYKADYQGALKYGFKAYHISNQHYTINDITKKLHQNY